MKLTPYHSRLYYLKLLRESVIPELQRRENFDELWWQQDGAPPHFANIVRAFLHQVFPQRWIGGRGPVEWPARSPDITPPDFSFRVTSKTRCTLIPLTV
ncbi:hypothetical protein B7P43_G16385 [Cryptotermes secundus]|uniref:Tc1-like transposase DDE domain-containing protein n=1 Tax=Cryptotermes secundus TaxID=105785 RepID=A0A2J7R0C7_9NEOP|nr:hypothetical protein B7P43_G16385 [Cryptotermes secundus]